MIFFQNKNNKLHADMIEDQLREEDIFVYKVFVHISKHLKNHSCLHDFEKKTNDDEDEDLEVKNCLLENESHITVYVTAYNKNSALYQILYRYDVLEILNIVDCSTDGLLYNTLCLLNDNQYILENNQKYQILFDIPLSCNNVEEYYENINTNNEDDLE